MSSRMRLYDEPRYYDIAFGWDITPEADFLEEVFRRFGRGNVRSVLDLACGTGRFALELARRGYLAAGLDVSRDMLAYAREQAAAKGLGVELFLKDMTDFTLYRTFDAAVCMTGSVGYLTTAETLVQHLKRVAVHLVQGGLYVVDVPLVAGFDLPPPQEWTGERERIKVSVRWELLGPYDAQSQTATERLVLRGQERGWERAWEQETTFRLLRAEDIEPATEASGHFRVAAVFGGFDIESRVQEQVEGHRALVVLERVTAPEPVSAGDEEPRDGGGRPGRGGRGRDGRSRDGRPHAGRGRDRERRGGSEGHKRRDGGDGRQGGPRRDAGSGLGSGVRGPGGQRGGPGSGGQKAGAGGPLSDSAAPASGSDTAAVTAGAGAAPAKKRRRRRGGRGRRREGPQAGGQPAGDRGL